MSTRITVAIKYRDALQDTSRTFRDERKARNYVQDMMAQRIDIRSFAISDAEQTEVYTGRGVHLFTIGGAGVS